MAFSRVDLAVIRAVEVGMEYNQTIKIIDNFRRSTLIVAKNRSDLRSGVFRNLHEEPDVSVTVTHSLARR